MTEIKHIFFDIGGVLGSNGWDPEDLITLFDLVETGKLKVLIDKAYPLENAADAVRVIEDRAVFGKVVVTP